MKHYTTLGWQETEPACPLEASLTLNVNGQAWVTLQCLPENLDALAAGFLFNDGVIHSREEISLIQVCPDGSQVDVWLNHAAERPIDWRITSGCGGGQSAAVYDKPISPQQPEGLKAVLQPNEILLIVCDFLDQTQSKRVRGTHSSAIYALPFPLHARINTDIGRHNTLDKLAGQALLDGQSIEGSLLITTGRISADMLQKAARMGSPVIISLRSATSMALRLAQDWKITLVTHASRGGFDLLTDTGRLSA